MGLMTLFFIALGLSMDAFAVSISNGMCYKNFGKKQVVHTALAFGLFQGLMPMLGYFAGKTFSNAISSFDHWIAVLLLSVIGGKMIYDGLSDLRSPEACAVNRSFTLGTLLLQAVATSIDALAIGISFAVMQVNIVVAAGFIGATTFVCCLFGSLLGHKFGMVLGKKAEIFGGAILVCIGLKIFVEHMFGG